MTVNNRIRTYDESGDLVIEDVSHDDFTNLLKGERQSNAMTTLVPSHNN